jgi:hypothetical protein
MYSSLFDNSSVSKLETENGNGNGNGRDTKTNNSLVFSCWNKYIYGI